MRKISLSVTLAAAGVLMFLETNMQAQDVYRVDSIDVHEFADSTLGIVPSEFEKYEYHENGEENYHERHRWISDSLKRLLYYSESRTFNADDLLEGYEYKETNFVTGNLQNSSRERHSYTGNLHEILSDNWNPTNSVYDNYSKYEIYSYPNAKDSCSTRSLWVDSIQDYVPGTKYLYYYDANNNITSDYYFTYDTSNTKWDTTSYHLYYYSGSVLDSNTSFYDYGSGIEKTNKTEFFYDAAGNDTVSINYYYSQMSGQYSLSSKTNKTYDANSNLLENMYSLWSGVALEPYNKQEYTYDGSNNRTSYANYNWVDSTSSWVGTSKTEYTFNSLNEYDVATSYFWNSDSAKWLYNYRTNIFFNENVKTEDVWLPADSDYDFREYAYMRDSIRGYMYINNQFVLGETFDFYYSANTAGIGEEKFNADISTYPNPTTDYLNLDLHRKRAQGIIEVFDLNGKSVMVQPFKGQSIVNIEVSKLVPGAYVYTVSSMYGKQSGKFIKR